MPRQATCGGRLAASMWVSNAMGVLVTAIQTFR
jgi:hypothetical protein